MANQQRRTSKNQQAAEARRIARKKKQQKRLALMGVMALAAILILTSLGLGALGGGTTEEASNTSTTQAARIGQPAQAAPVPAGRTISGPTPCPAATGEERASQFAQAPTNCIDPAKKYTATFDMNVGKVVVELNEERAPIAVNNFVVLARYGFYDGSAIFRTDPSIDIIQGGSPNTQTNNDTPGYQILDDPQGFTYTEGELIMARGGAPNSAGSQFFFSTGPNVSNLNSQGTYVTIGKVTEGLDVLKRIIGTHVDTGGRLGGGPRDLVVINKLTITES